MTSHTDNISGYSPFVLWFTGISGSGKSTLSNAVKDELRDLNISPLLLDGDILRTGLCNDLDFSLEDREENVRRAAEVSKLFFDSGIVVISALISPTNRSRSMAKQIIGEGNFFEIHVDCPISICEKRDVKGLYKLARAGEVSAFTGISSPYETPKSPHLVLHTNLFSVEECVNKIVKLIEAKKIIKK